MNTFARIATIKQSDLIGLPYNILSDSSESLLINNILNVFSPIYTFDVKLDIITKYNTKLDVIEVYKIALKQG